MEKKDFRVRQLEGKVETRTRGKVSKVEEGCVCGRVEVDGLWATQEGRGVVVDEGRGKE